MKRLALPLERIWKTMEDKIECPTELDWLDLNERAQITAYTTSSSSCLQQTETRRNESTDTRNCEL